MTRIKLSKDQIQKVVLSALGFVALLYVYLTFFLGPLNTNRERMLASIADLQGKLGASKSEMAKAKNLERQASAATARFAALKALSPEGAPIAWFPPRMKTFFANQQIDKATARLDNNTPFTQPELNEWTDYEWMVDLPEADYSALGQAIAELENTEPLLHISRLSIRGSSEEPGFQQVALAVSTIMEKQ